MRPPRRDDLSIAVAVVLFLAAAATLHAQERTALIGFVRDAANGEGVEAAAVDLDNGKYLAHTDGAGRFQIPDVAPGRYEVRVQHLGHTSNRMRITVPSGRTAEVEFHLVLDPLPLEELRVQVSREPLSLGRLSGFYERLGSGFGQFLTRKDLERIGSRRLGDALRRVSGVRIRHCPRSDLVMGRCLPIEIRGCAPAYVWIDGFRIDADSYASDLVSFNTEDIEGVEVYSTGNMPAQFHPGKYSSCSMVIWTRRSK